MKEIESATAGTTGHEKPGVSVRSLGEAKPRLKTRKEITKSPNLLRVSMRAHSVGCLGGHDNRKTHTGIVITKDGP